MENSSTDMQGWNSTRLRKTQVHICRKRKYENGLTRLSVSGRIQRTNNGVESFHNTLRNLVKVSHPRFYAFLEYLQEVTLSNMADVQRLHIGEDKSA